MIEIKAIASGSKGNCYSVSDGKTPLLLEAGITFRRIQEALDFQTSSIAACLITHEHQDHCKGVKSLLAKGMDVYTSEGTARAIGDDVHEHHRLHAIKYHEPFKVGTWSIYPFEVDHDVAEPVGYLLVNQEGEKLLFATDTYYIRYKFKGLTHIMVECNYAEDIVDENVENGRIPAFLQKRLLRSHFSLEHVKDFLRANDLSRVEEIHLLHLSDNNSDEGRFIREVQEVTGKITYAH